VLLNEWQVIIMNKQMKIPVMHLLTLGKRKALSHKPTHSLTQGAVPTFHMIGLSTLFSYLLMPACFYHQTIRLPKITVALSLFISFWYFLPKLSATRLASITCKKTDHLTGSATKSYPHPTFECLAIDKWPQLIHFQYILLVGSDQSLFQGWKGAGFFFTHRKAVW